MGVLSHKGSQAPSSSFMLIKAGGQSVHTTSIGFGTLSTDQGELYIVVGHHLHVSTFGLPDVTLH